MFLKQQIRMICEGSRDAEDWRNDAEKLALHHRDKLHIKYYCFYCILSQINAAFCSKTFQNLTSLKLLNGRGNENT